jgi:hypothetical protein
MNHTTFLEKNNASMVVHPIGVHDMGVHDVGSGHASVGLYCVGGIAWTCLAWVCMKHYFSSQAKTNLPVMPISEKTASCIITD